MPIDDINGKEIVHHSGFPDDEVNNIEFGAGKNHFGKKEFPNCYLTDLTIPNLPHFTTYPQNYENNDCHYLDHECDYFDTDLNGKTFDNLIFCNPNEFGFLGPGHAKDFLNRAGELLNDDGFIYILGHTKNPWSQSRKIKRYLEKLTIDEELDFKMKIIEIEPLNAQHNYILNYKYTRCDAETPTIPNEKIIIQKIAS